MNQGKQAQILHQNLPNLNHSWEFPSVNLNRHLVFYSETSWVQDDHLSNIVTAPNPSQYNVRVSIKEDNQIFYV